MLQRMPKATHTSAALTGAVLSSALVIMEYAGETSQISIYWRVPLIFGVVLLGFIAVVLFVCGRDYFSGLTGNATFFEVLPKVMRRALTCGLTMLVIIFAFN